jgi:hypothetical protein
VDRATADLILPSWTVALAETGVMPLLLGRSAVGVLYYLPTGASPAAH